MTPGIRHRLTKTDNIQPLPKRAPKKSKPKPDTFEPKPNKLEFYSIGIVFP